MTIILIGNYQSDRQESMERFALMLQAGLINAGLKAEIWRPVPVFGRRFKSTTAGWAKWMGYVDKWLLFPIILRFKRYKLNQETKIRFHICDHSNAPYLKHLPVDRTVITCHDVLAIRGAMGFEDAHCQSSVAGKILQKWILYHLSRARRLASVSNFTFEQLTNLSQGKLRHIREWKVIYNSFNGNFKPMLPAEIALTLSNAGLNPQSRFILHVGSNLQRKNRGLLLNMLSEMGDKYNGYIYFAGQPINDQLVAQAKQLGIEDRVLSIVKPDHSLLVALYAACEAFIFPSFTEGFGWPIIEAQSCGAPVITSNIGALLEVGGDAALHRDPYNPKEFADAFLFLRENNVRTEVIQKGFQNIKRFEAEKMMEGYLDLYQVNGIKKY